MLPSSFSTAASAPKEVTRTCFDGEDIGDRWVLTKSHTPPNPQHACEENSRRSVKSSLIAHRTGSAMEWIGWAKRNKASVPIIISAVIVVIVTVESSSSFGGVLRLLPRCTPMYQPPVPMGKQQFLRQIGFHTTPGLVVQSWQVVRSRGCGWLDDRRREITQILNHKRAGEAFDCSLLAFISGKISMEHWMEDTTPTTVFGEKWNNTNTFSDRARIDPRIIGGLCWCGGTVYPAQRRRKPASATSGIRLRPNEGRCAIEPTGTTVGWVAVRWCYGYSRRLRR